MCHDHLHRTHQEHKIERKSRGFRDATHMGMIRWRIYEQAKGRFPHVHMTYGYLTKHTRITHELEKSHLMDARCISQHPLAGLDGTWYLIKQVRRNNRHLHCTKRASEKGKETAEHRAEVCPWLSSL
jgi:hypothetical protein